MTNIVTTLRKIFPLLWCSVLVTACSTAYQHSDVFSYGFSEKQLSENVWRVTFEGNSSTSINEAYDKATLRAADIAISRGYAFFAINDVQNTINSTVQTLPGGNTATMATPLSGGPPVLVNTRSKGMTFSSNYPTSTLTASMYKEKPEGISIAYEARYICTKLGSEYGAVCGESSH